MSTQVPRCIGPANDPPMVASPADTPRVAARIAIVGGGIGGLAAAAFLHRAGLPCVIYEQAAELTEVGAGLVLAPNAVRLLRRLGVMDRLRDRAVPLDIGWEFRRWEDGRVLSAENLAGSCERLYGERTYTVHRADLLDAIGGAVPPGTVRLGKRCTSVTVDGADRGADVRRRERVDADVVIGADGVHSTVRGALTDTRTGDLLRASAPSGRSCPPTAHPPSPAAAPRPCGSAPATTWCTTRSPAKPRREPRRVRPRRRATRSSRGARPRRSTSSSPSSPDGTRACRNSSETPEPPAAGRCWTASHSQRWSHGPVTLLGDAAHPMFPFFAQGAAQSIEDAATLAALPRPGHPGTRTARYATTSRCGSDRTTRLQEISHARAHDNHLPDGPEQQARDASLAAADPLVANGWIYAHDADVENATRV